MMRFEYDPNFIEQATFWVAKRNPERECMLHEHLDSLYGIADAELRQRAFHHAYADLFRRFGLDQLVPRYVQEFPLVVKRLNRCVIREAERNRAQSVDLYIRESGDSNGGGERTLIMALSPESILDQERMTPWLRRQLQHVEDMVDERFAYDTQLPDVSPVHQNLIRDRYAVLWDIYIEGRLIRSGKLGDSAVPELWRSFCKAFKRRGRVQPDRAGPSRRVFENLLGASGLTHDQMLNWAVDPGVLLGKEEEDVLDEKAQVCVAE